MTSAPSAGPQPGAGARPSPVRLAYGIFFLSGVAALIYEVSWARQIGLLLGHTAHAAAVVLTAYFAGLAVGYALGSSLHGRVDPIRAYAFAEFAAAGWACLLAFLLPLAADLAGFLRDSSPLARFVLCWLFCFLALLPATAALGATLPLFAGWLSPDWSPAKSRVASAYACNTAGAFVGVVATTVWLLVDVGVTGSALLAAGLSVLCGIVALLLGRRDHLRVQVLDPAAEAGQAGSPGWSFLPAALSGFGILALEVLYFRLFSLVFHNSTYTFGAVLAAVVLALALGPLFVQAAAKRLPGPAVVAWAAAAGAVATVLSVSLFALVTRFDYFRFGSSFASYLAGAFALVAIVVLPPMTLLGMILPAVWCGDPGPGGAGRLVGRTAFVNALAGGVGAAASLLLLPALGLWGAFGLVALSFLLLALALLAAQRRPGSAALCALAFAVAAAPLVVPPGPERFAAPGPDVLVRRWESAYGWIDVVSDGRGTRKIRQNLHYRFGTTGEDAPRAYRQAHLPLVLHPQPSKVLFLGLGTGLTAGAAAAHPEVERATVVELIPEVAEAARLLADANFGVVGHPKFEVRIDDARHFLLATDRRFDVVVSDLFVPWESETGYLYTVEHYRAARRRLKPGGLFCQWLPAYQLGPRELELIADSFASVFPETSLWWGHLDARRPILALVGSEGQLLGDEQGVDVRLRRVYETAPRDEEMKTVRDVASRYLGHWQVRRPAYLNTDEHPRVEFLTPVSEGDGALLQGEALRRYYDDILARLPDRSGRFAVTQEEPSVRRAWHRLVLFPE